MPVTNRLLVVQGNEGTFGNGWTQQTMHVTSGYLGLDKWTGWDLENDFVKLHQLRRCQGWSVIPRTGGATCSQPILIWQPCITVVNCSFPIRRTFTFWWPLMRTIVSNAIINYVTVHDTVVALHLTPYSPIVSLRAHNKIVAQNDAFCSIDTKNLITDYRLCQINMLLKFGCHCSSYLGFAKSTPLSTKCKENNVKCSISWDVDLGEAD